MAASITLAGESLIAQKQAAGQVLTVARFVLANVPGLNVAGPVNRAAAKPPAGQIVFTANVTQRGFVNPNQVVYSLMMGTDIGDFDWNWIGLETSDNVLLSVAYVPLQQKRKNILPNQIGNNVTRNFLVVFDGAQQLTAITIDASTWQFDYTARMTGIDERERLSNRDIFGRACFFGTGLQLEKVGSVYQLKAGLAYVEGIRLERAAVTPVTVPLVPNKAWLDVVLQRELSDVVGTFQVVFGTGKVDYTDSVGARHYLVPLADLPSSTVVTDLRTVEPIGSELIKHFAARVGDYQYLRARATTKDDVGLSNIPNAISDDADSNSSSILATTKMVAAVRGLLHNAIEAIISGASTAGKAAKLATARTISLTGSATGSGSFDGAANLSIAVTVDPTKHTHAIGHTTGLQAALDAKLPTSGGTVNGPLTLSSAGWAGLTLQGGYNDRVMLHAGGQENVHEFRIGRYSRTDGAFISNPFVFNMVTGALTATSFNGSGAGLTALNASNLGSGLIPDARLSGTYTDVNITGNAATASKWATPRTITFTEGATGSFNLDGSGNVSVALTVPPAAHTHTIAQVTGLSAALLAAAPPGQVADFAMATAPAGWIKCNGAAISRTTYAALFAAIGTVHGAGDGSTTFNIPDYRGVFRRGLDEGRGLDPNRVLGSLQSTQNQSHNHTATTGSAGVHSHPGSTTSEDGDHSHTFNYVNTPTSANSPGTGAAMHYTGINWQATNRIQNAGNHIHALVVAADGAHTHTVSVAASGGNESRPVNVAVGTCIKY